MNFLLVRIGLVAAGLMFLGTVLSPVSTFAQSDQHGTGYEPDPPEQPGTISHVPRFRAFLPAFKDLSPRFPPPGDQGRQGSCVAWSVGYALRGYYYRQRTQISGSSPSSLFSPAYVYNQLVRTPDCSGGSNIRAALELLRTEGIATLVDFPYDDRSCVRKPTGDIKQRAVSNAISGYRSFGRAREIRPDDVKGSLLAGDPVEIGMNINQPALSHLRRGQIYDQDGPASFDGHAMVVTGFDDRIQAFKVINSWGTKWADDGFGWISYRAFTANTLVAFVVNDAGGVTPSPVPSPLPAPLPTPAPAPAPLPRTTDMTELARMIAARANDFSCARVVLQPTSSNAATLRGWVATQADLNSLNNMLRTVPAGVQIASEVRSRPWPQCEALMTVSDAVAVSHDMVMATIDHEGTDYQAGSRLILRVRSPDFASYLYVTYLPASGDAVLLYKPPGIVPQALPPRTVVDLGAGGDPRVFKVGPPFGAEAVIAIATASPLFTDGIPASATQRDYLTALRKTLLYKPDPNRPDRLVDAKVIALTTRE
jgi:papain like protease/uncharacterized protein DUF4384